MTAEILSVGTELLMGQIANTDAQYISRRLAELGITIYRQATVGDNPARLREALTQALGRADLVITTGGLGPTEDDLTKETVAEVMGKTLVMHRPSYQRMVRWLEKVGRPLTDNNLKQAMLPEDAVVLDNVYGTAPGCIMERDGRAVAVLPGPPHELKAMFEGQLAPWLMQKSGVTIRSKFLHVFGIGESLLETMLKDLFHTEDPTLALYCSPGEVVCRVTSRADTDEEALKRIRPLEEEILSRVGDHFYGEGADLTINRAAFEALRARGQTVCFAESLTGGRLAASIVDCPGASDVLKESYITYCDEAKHRVLGVRQDTLDRFTCVSAQCAAEMAEGARRISKADWGVSTTGIAGPDGGTADTPVGTVFIGIAGPNGARGQGFRFAGDRDAVRLQAVKWACDILRKEIGKA
ncbi:MAG: competence/damage-inducible protein A [Clostridiales bacterium]|nr:competence/damage-inducible protein A [Clostridiales bacterium]